MDLGGKPFGGRAQVLVGNDAAQWRTARYARLGNLDE